jgi:DNA-binding PadR family transcriptional regulator
MSVKHGLLTILTEHALAGYDLRSEFEQRTGGTWPLNISQIYSTLQRLERDGLVESTADDSDATLWNITDAGRAEAENWWYTATARSTPSREEASIKVTLAITSPYVDTAQVIRTQRTESLRALRDYTKLKSKLGPINSLSREDLAWAMLLDSYIFTLEAELRWLDHVESRIAMGFANLAPATPSATGPTQTDGLVANGTKKDNQ